MKVLRLKPYLRAMKDLGFDDTDMRAVEAAIIAAPHRHPIIKGLGGVRKARFARPGTGKSGGGRVVYLALLRDGVLAMLTAYPKNEKDDLTPADRRALLRAIEVLASGNDG